MTLWKGEFLGILSELFSPYENAGMVLHPTILKNAQLAYGNLMAVKQGHKFWKEAGHDFLKQTISAYNAGYKIKEKGLLSGPNGKFIRATDNGQALYRQWRKDVLKQPDAVFESTTKTPFHKRLKTHLMSGDKQEFQKQFMVNLYALATDYFNKGYTETGMRVTTLDDALKKAWSSMQISLKSTNPNYGGSLLKKNIVGQANSAQFLKWLKKGEREGTVDKGTVLKLIRDEIEWTKRYNNMVGSMPYWVRKNRPEHLKLMRGFFKENLRLSNPKKWTR
jgi:hypothetical protein